MSGRTEPVILVGITCLCVVVVVAVGVLVADIVSRSAPEPALPAELLTVQEAWMPTPPQEEAAHVAAAEAAAAVRGLDGCGVAGRSGLRTHREVREAVHSWLTYTPSDYDASRRYPIVLLFHRSSRSAVSFMRASDMMNLAEKFGFIVVTVESLTSPPWQSPDDVATVRAAIEHVRATRCIDRSRVFAVGDGAGVRFARNLGCMTPLSAVAGVLGGQHTDEELCKSEPPTPFMRVYGLSDKDVPAKGGAGCSGGRPFMSADAVAAAWREANRCEGRGEVWVEERGQKCTIWSCDAAFVSCALDGGHEWPTAPIPLFKLPKCASDALDFALGDAIWRFFDEHGRAVDIEEFE